MKNKLQKRLLGLFFFCCLITALSAGGCGNRMKYEKYHEIKSPIYAATAFNARFIYKAWFGKYYYDLFSKKDYRILSLIALFDLPVAIVADTVTLPYDGYVYYQRRKRDVISKTERE